MQLYNLGSDEDPRNTIALDEVETLVEEIVAHDDRGGTKKTDLDFQVKWLNQPPEENTWIPYNEARPVEAFGRYIQKHPELSKFGIFPDHTDRPLAKRRKIG